MSEQMTGFRTVLRGYEPAEVERRITELQQGIEAERQRSAALDQELEQLRQAQPPDADEDGNADQDGNAARPAGSQAVKLNYAEVGERVGQILTLAEEEAARILSVARLAADQLLSDAEQTSSHHREEAQTFYDEQRARATRLAAEFDETLVERRDKAEQDFQARSDRGEQQLQATQAELAAAQEKLAQLGSETEQATAAHQERAREIAESKDEAERIVAEATAHAEGIRTEAAAHADSVRAEAAAHADGLRADAERELAASLAQRDEIDAQLTNVRAVLATLAAPSGRGATPSPSPGADEDAAGDVRGPAGTGVDSDPKA